MKINVHEKTIQYFAHFLQDLPFFFPANYAYYLNGTAIPPNSDNISADAVIAVQGIIPREKYKDMLKQEYFGRNVTVDFHGYNREGSLLFWSSAPFSYASSLLALTQYRALLKAGQLKS